MIDPEKDKDSEGKVQRLVVHHVCIMIHEETTICTSKLHVCWISRQVPNHVQNEYLTIFCAWLSDPTRLPELLVRWTEYGI